MTQPEETGKSALLLEEWREMREQVRLLLTAIWRLESAAIFGLAAFYAWFYSLGRNIWIERLAQSVAGQSEGAYFFKMACLSSVPAIFSIFVLVRLKIEYAILTRLTEYIRHIEIYFYKSNKIGNRISGWEEYLRNNKPDRICFCAVFRSYSNTFTAFTSIAGICIAVSFINWTRFYCVFTKTEGLCAWIP